MKAKTFFCIIAFAVLAWQQWCINDNLKKLHANMLQVSANTQVLQLGVKSHIDAERQNLQIDSTLWNWQLRYWTPRDAFILDKMSKAASDKANNLKQALNVFNNVDSVVVQSKTTFVTDEGKQQAKQTISFKH